MQHLDPEPHRLRHERRFICVHNRPFPHQIHLRRRHHLRPLQQLPAKIQYRRHDQHRVVTKERRDTGRSETRVPKEQNDEDLTHQPDPGAVGLEVAVVREFLAVDPLGDGGFVEAEVRDAHDDVVDDAAGGDEVDEPGEDLRGAVGELQEGEEGKAHGDEETPEWDAVGGACVRDGVSFSGCGREVSGRGGES